MLAKTALLMLAALAASVSAAEAGMGNLNIAAAARVNPTIPVNRNLSPRTIDARIKLHCHYVRERNDLGVWERRTHCH